LAAELGIKFTQKVDTSHKDFVTSEANRRKEAEKKEEELISLKKASRLRTERWNIKPLEQINPPVGCRKDPAPTLHSRGNEEFYSYDGEWRNGYLEGRGVYKFDDDQCYEGEFRSSQQHGEGRAQYPHGQSFSGGWKKGRIDGQGTFTYDAGSVYAGEFEFGRRHGNGKLTYPCGLVFVGEFR
jgi:hypothetical protein